MSLSLIYKDELKGFYKTKVMLFLWTGLPLIAFVLHFWNPQTDQEMPLTLLCALLITSISGTLSSIMLTVAIVHEKIKGVYTLFLIRPVRRWHLLLGKFFAVYTCIAIAALLTVGVGLMADYFSKEGISAPLIESTLDALIICFSGMAISCSAGILIGVVSPSVLVGVILVIYGGNQMVSASWIPAMLGMQNTAVVSIAMGLVLSSIMLAVSIFIFNKKQF